MANSDQLLPLLDLASMRSPKVLEVLAGATRRTFRARALVVEEGARAEEVFFLRSGKLKVVAISSEGRDETLALIGPGEIFGELAVMHGGARSASVVALERCEVDVLSRDAFLRLLTLPEVSLRVIELLAARLRRLTERAGDIAFLPLPARLAKKLLELAGPARGGRVTLPVQLSQRDLGELVGATREAVNKVLATWRRRGLVEVDGRVIGLTDPAALRALAEK